MVNKLSTLAVMFPHQATTAGVTVRVAVNYLAEQSDPSAGRWFWSYHVRLENGGAKAVQLLSRQWQIVDGRGVVQQVVGEGVVGNTPLIATGASFDYVSGCPLTTASGWMEGRFLMIDEDGQAFDAAIPRFSLIGPIA